MERKWPGCRWEQTTHRQCDRADEKSVLLPKAHHGVGGSTAQVWYPRAAIQATKCDAREVLDHPVTPNRQLPFLPRVQPARGSVTPSDQTGVTDSPAIALPSSGTVLLH